MSRRAFLTDTERDSRGLCRAEKNMEIACYLRIFFSLGGAGVPPPRRAGGICRKFKLLE